MDRLERPLERSSEACPNPDGRGVYVIFVKDIVTGKDVWNVMPECSVGLIDDIQAYNLKHGTWVWCLASPIPRIALTAFRGRGLALNSFVSLVAFPDL